MGPTDLCSKRSRSICRCFFCSSLPAITLWSNAAISCKQHNGDIIINHTTTVFMWGAFSIPNEPRTYHTHTCQCADWHWPPQRRAPGQKTGPTHTDRSVADSVNWGYSCVDTMSRNMRGDWLILFVRGRGTLPPQSGSSTVLMLHARQPSSPAKYALTLRSVGEGLIKPHHPPRGKRWTDRYQYMHHCTKKVKQLTGRAI